jgi:hypothetical protein
MIYCYAVTFVRMFYLWAIEVSFKVFIMEELRSKLEGMTKGEIYEMFPGSDESLKKDDLIASIIEAERASLEAEGSEGVEGAVEASERAIRTGEGVNKKFEFTEGQIAMSEAANAGKREALLKSEGYKAKQAKLLAAKKAERARMAKLNKPVKKK